LLCGKIDNFIRDRITVADRVIVSYGLQKIQDGDVILTYARYNLILYVRVLIHFYITNSKHIVKNKGHQLYRHYY
jgi:translation initiation factor 2B subunit (eIF-2B alpha/beta/delta family)